MLAIVRRDRFALWAMLLGVSAASWGYLFVDAWRMNHGRSCCVAMAKGWRAEDVGMLFVMWSVMMVAMMTPTASPMVMTFAMVQRQRAAAARVVVPTGIFLSGYLLAWIVYSVPATALQWWLHQRALLSPDMVSTSKWLGGSVLLGAGVFQFTPMKRACLKHCRSPLDFILTGWREGTGGAMVMGLRHGLSCIGCCWVLMALLFVLGVMNLTWVAAITAFVILEKTVGGKWVSAASGAVCIAWAVLAMIRH